MISRRRQVVTGVTAGLLGSGATAILLIGPSLTNAAGDSGDTTEQTDTTVASDATSADDDSGESVEDQLGDVEDELREVLQPLVDDGTLTQEQLDAIVGQLGGATVDVPLPEMIFGDSGWPGDHEMIIIEGGNPMHPGGPGGPVGPGGPFERGGRDGPFGLAGPLGLLDADAIAAMIGIDADDLREQLREGATVAEIATANGVDPQTIVDGLVDEISDHLAVSVEHGRLTEDEAAEHVAEMTERITEWILGDDTEAESGTTDDAESEDTAPADTTPTDETATTTSA